MNWNSKLLLALAGMAVYFSGCAVIDPPEDDVTFVNISEYQVLDSSAKKSLANPTSVFVYAKGNSIGTFTLPAKVPVVSNETIELRLVPGVTRNGVSAYQSIYAPYYGQSFTLKPQNGKTIEITPVAGFRPTVQQSNFLFEEDFESSNQFLHLSGDTTFKVVSQTGCSTCGQKVGRFEFTDTKRSTEIISNKLIAKPSKETYLELNYKNTVDFKVGVTYFDGSANPTEYYLTGFKPKSQWNKVYIPLNEVLQYDKNTTQFLILIKAELPTGSTSGQVDLDNIRIVAY